MISSSLICIPAVWVIEFLRAEGSPVEVQILFFFSVIIVCICYFMCIMLYNVLHILFVFDMFVFLFSFCSLICSYIFVVMTVFTTSLKNSLLG